MSVTFSKVAVSFAIYLYVFANAEAICALFNPFKDIIIIFEAILRQLYAHITKV